MTDTALTTIACALAAAQTALMWRHRPQRHVAFPTHDRIEASPQKLAQYRALLAKKEAREAEIRRHQSGSTG